VEFDEPLGNVEEEKAHDNEREFALSAPAALVGRSYGFRQQIEKGRAEQGACAKT
jgi:hypothetical protein